MGTQQPLKRRQTPTEPRIAPKFVHKIQQIKVPQPQLFRLIRAVGNSRALPSYEEEPPVRPSAFPEMDCAAIRAGDGGIRVCAGRSRARRPGESVCAGVALLLVRGCA